MGVLHTHCLLCAPSMPRAAALLMCTVIRWFASPMQAAFTGR